MPSPFVFDSPPTASLRLSVVIPARDEAALLPLALAALTVQADPSGRRLDPALYEVLILANNCRDATADAARRFARQNPQINIHIAERSLADDQANVGTARRLLMDEAYRRLLSVGRPDGVIASTDGDTVVAPDWAARTLQEVSRGADAVGGRISVGGHEDAGGRDYHRRDVTYQHLAARLESVTDPDPADPWPRHHQFFGGSLAVTAAAYRAVGGLPLVPCLEDVALGRALRRIDARLRHSPDVRVRTSARRCGRATLGLASQLNEWSGMAQERVPHLVQDPAALVIRFRGRACLRRVWKDARSGCGIAEEEIRPLADALCQPAATLLTEIDRSCEYFGLLWDWVMEAHDDPEGLWSRRWPLRPITEAITDLRALLSAQTDPAGSSPRVDRRGVSGDRSPRRV